MDKGEKEVRQKPPAAPSCGKCGRPNGGGFWCLLRCEGLQR